MWTSDMAGSKSWNNAIGTLDLYFSELTPILGRLSLRGDKDDYQLLTGHQKFPLKWSSIKIIRPPKKSHTAPIDIAWFVSIPDLFSVARQLGVLSWPFLVPILWSRGSSQLQLEELFQRREEMPGRQKQQTLSLNPRDLRILCAAQRNLEAWGALNLGQGQSCAEPCAGAGVIGVGMLIRGRMDSTSCMGGGILKLWEVGSCRAWGQVSSVS